MLLTSLLDSGDDDWAASLSPAHFSEFSLNSDNEQVYIDNMIHVEVCIFSLTAKIITNAK